MIHRSDNLVNAQLCEQRLAAPSFFLSALDPFNQVPWHASQLFAAFAESVFSADKNNMRFRALINT